MKKINMAAVVLSVIFLIFIYLNFSNINKEVKVENLKSNINLKTPVHTNKYSELGFKNISDILLLSSGKYILFYAVTEENPNGDSYLATLANWSIQKIKGFPVGVEPTMDRFITTDTNGSSYLYDISNDGNISVKKIINPGVNNVYNHIETGLFSPDHKLFVFKTFHTQTKPNETALDLLELDTGKITTISDSENLIHGGILAWFSDSERILENRTEYKKYGSFGGFDNVGHIGIWNTKTKLFDENLGIEEISPETPCFRPIGWMVPDKIFQVFCGGEDAKGDFIIDLDKKSLSYSPRLFFDQSLGKVVIMGGNYWGAEENVVVSIYNLKDYVLKSPKFFLDDSKDALYQHDFKDRLYRREVKIVNNSELLYLRESGASSSYEAEPKSYTDVVLFDSQDNTEKVLFRSEDPLHGLILSSNKKMWILPTKDQFIAQNL